MAKRKVIIRSRRLYCLFFYDLRLLMITFLLAIVLSVLHWSTTSDDHFSFGHCIVCPSTIYDFWWSFFFWPLYCLSFFDLRLLMIIFLLAIVLSVLRRSTTSDDHFSFGHCIICPSSIYDFWWSFFFWPLYCLSFVDLRLLMITFLLAIVLSVLKWSSEVVDQRRTDNTMAKRKVIIRSRRSKKDRQYNGQKKSDHQKS
jgi:hypothetical protein